jgi:hypothetical protein
VQREILKPKIDADSGEIALLEGVVCEPSKERRLADRAVTNDDNFEEVIVLSDHDIYDALIYNFQWDIMF